MVCRNISEGLLIRTNLKQSKCLIHQSPFQAQKQLWKRENLEDTKQLSGHSEGCKESLPDGTFILNIFQAVFLDQASSRQFSSFYFFQLAAHVWEIDLQLTSVSDSQQSTVYVFLQKEELVNLVSFSDFLVLLWVVYFLS